MKGPTIPGIRSGCIKAASGGRAMPMKTPTGKMWLPWRPSHARMAMIDVTPCWNRKGRPPEGAGPNDSLSTLTLSIYLIAMGDPIDPVAPRTGAGA